MPKDKKSEMPNAEEEKINIAEGTEQEEIQADEKEKEETKDAAGESTKIKMKDEAAALKDQLLRQAAEYDNYRKRTARERLEIEADVIARVAGDFLPVADNLERALAAECADPNYKTGVQMIYDSFKETLQKLGIEEIETDGEEFNPAYHQAVQQIENDEFDSGIIAGTYQKGYKIGKKIIRFAMVAVVK